MKNLPPFSKTVKRLGCFMFFLVTLFQPLRSEACVDYHPTIFVTCDYDAGFNEILVRVSNMQLFGSPQGVFCSCGISNYTDVFSDIQYVSFVDSGTTNPVSGFVPWSGSTTAASSWNTVQSGNWDAFLAETTASGLATGDPVDLIIRASLPAGYTFTYLDTNLVVTAIGTDEYSTATGSVTMGHNSISNFPSTGIVYTEEPLSYFSTIDNIITDVIAIEQKKAAIKTYPNPFSDELIFELELETVDKVEVFITDLAGKRVHTFLPKNLNTGKNKLRWQPNHIPNGIYLISIKTKNAIKTEQIVLAKE
jgi:hypothetical protein